MNEEMNPIHHGDEAIKIVFLRVNAGYEKNIVRMIKSILDQEIKKNTNVIEYKFFKILGLYDVMLIYRCREFRHDLLNKGTFENVVHSNEILCFPLQRANDRRFSLKTDLQAGIVISLLKLRLEVLLDFGLQLHDAVAKYMEQVENLHVLGGLGWNEFLIFYPHEFKSRELNKIFNEFLLDTATLNLRAHGKTIPLIEKVYSFIGVSYDVLNDVVQKLPSKFDHSEGNACPTFKVSVYGPDFDLVNQSISKVFKRGSRHFLYDDPRMMTGVHDIFISFKRGSWGQFLKGVIDFRKLHQASILDTRTEITAPVKQRDSGVVETEVERDRIQFPELILGKTETCKILDRPGTTDVISTLYRFNNLFQNPLLRDSFLDLYVPANKLIDGALSKDAADNWTVSDEELNESLREFRYAIQERAMGAYLFTEDDEHLFSPIKGGLQKLLMALASIPCNLLNYLIKDKPSWRGYISIGLKNEPMHFVENLHVPFSHALYPDTYWWCLIHEIGHVLCLRWEVISRKHYEIKNTIDRLAKKSDVHISAFRNLADNAFADIFDFMIGFLGNRSFYFKTCWGFLIDHIQNSSQPRQIFMRHLLRHFVGWVYEGKFLLEKRPLRSLDNIETLIDEANGFLAELRKVPKMKSSIQAYTRRSSILGEDLVGESIPLLSLLDHFSTFLTPVIGLQKELKAEYESERFEKLIATMQDNGEIVSPDLIKFPHLIPLKLMENRIMKKGQGKVNFRTRMAVILSLYWYSHKHILPSILNLRVKG